MSDSSAIRQALGGYPDKEKQGDSATLRKALQDLQYNTQDQIYNLPYKSSSTPSNYTPPPQDTTPAPTQNTQTVSYTPTTTTPPPQSMTPQGANTGNWFNDLVSNAASAINGVNSANMQNQQTGIQQVQGLGITDPTASGILGTGLGALESLGQAAGGVAGLIGGGVNNLPVIGEPIQQAAGIIGGRYNEANATTAGLGAALTKLTDPNALAARVGTNIVQQTQSGKPFDLNSLVRAELSPTFAGEKQQTLTPSEQTTQLAANTWTAIQKGDAGAAVKNALGMVYQYGDDQYNKLDPAQQLIASFAFDPLNFIPGMGIGEAAQKGTLETLTKGVPRITEAADLLPKTGFFGRFGTPAAKVTEVVKTGLQNFALRTVFAKDADEMFNAARAFETAGRDAASFDEVVKTYAGLASVPAQRASKLLQGFGDVIDATEQGYRALEQGIQAAGDTSKLPKTFARFAEDVKAGRAAESDLLEVTQAELATAAQKHMAQSAAKLYPLQNVSAPINIAKRFMNNLKGAEALAYIGLSPVTFVKNLVNGVTTMAIEGVNPLFNAEKEIARLRKLGQVDRALDLQRAVSLQKTMTKTGGVVRQALGEGSFATAQTGAFGNFMSKITRTPLGAGLRWYEGMENSMRAKVWTNTYYKAMAHNWDVGKWIPEMDSATQAVLHQYRVDPTEITNIIKEAGNDKGAIIRNVSDYMDGKRGAAIDWDKVASEMGVSKQELTSLMDEHDAAQAHRMANEIAQRVMAGESKPEVVNEVVGQAAKEYADATVERIGVELPPAERLTQLEARMQEIDDAQVALRNGQKNIPKANRAAYDDLENELEALQNEQSALHDQLGYTDEEHLFGKAPVTPEPAPAVGAAPVAPSEVAPPETQTPDWLRQNLDTAYNSLTPAQRTRIEEMSARRLTAQQVADALGVDRETVALARSKMGIPSQTMGAGFVQQPNPDFEKWLQEYQARKFPSPSAPPPLSAEPIGTQPIETSVPPVPENPLPPQDLPSIQLTQGQQNAQQYLLNIKRADGAPVYTADQLATWRPDTLERIAGEMQSTQATLDSVLKTASQKGIATATEKGAPNNKNLLAVLNKHGDYTIYDAAGKVTGYKEGAFKTIEDVQRRADEAKQILDEYGHARIRELDPEAVRRQETEWLKRQQGNPPSGGDMANPPTNPKVIPPAGEPVAPTEPKLNFSYGSTKIGETAAPAETVVAKDLQGELVALKRVNLKQADFPQGVFTGTLDGKPAWSNGHFIDISEPPSKFRLNDRHPDMQLLAPKTRGRLASPSEVLDVKDNIYKKAVMLKTTDGTEIPIADKYYANFAKKYKNLEFYVTTDSSPIEVYSNGQRVGILMPMDKGWVNKARMSGRVADQIPANQTFNEQGLYGEIQKQIDAQTEIERLRNIAQEDENATKILSRDEMVKAKARTQADVLEALMNLWNSEDVRRVQLGTDAKNRVMSWLRREVLNSANDAHNAAVVAADWMDNAVMISRDQETVFDAALGVLSPFQFWRSRFALESLRRVADKPARLSWYLKLRDMQDQIHGDPRFPKRLQGRMFIPAPFGFVPDWAGGGMFLNQFHFDKGIWVDAAEQLTSIKQVFNLDQFPNDVTDQDVAANIRALAERGEISLTDASNAIANGKGTLWEQTKQRLQELSQSNQGADDFASMFRPHLPLDILWKLKTGNASEIGVLFPMTRLVRGATALLPKGNFLNQSGQGFNIEQPLKAGLRAVTGQNNIPDWDKWDMYRTDRALADMVGEGLVNERDAMLAMIERKGTFYDQAVARAQQQMTLQNYSVFGGNIFPKGEQQYYQSVITRNNLINQAVAQLGGNPDSMSYGEKYDLIKANGLNKKGTPLGNFYTQHPEWNARQDAYAEPEQRMKGFLTDEMWTTYGNLSALDKRLARNADPALASFITNPQRDYTNTTLDQLGSWVKTLKGYLPVAELTPLVPNAPQFTNASPDQSKRYQRILDSQMRYFGDLSKLQPKFDTYNKLSPTDKKAYRAVNADLDAYYKWYGAQMKANPDLDKLLHPNYASNFKPYPPNTRAGTNSVIRQATANLDKMAYKIGDASTRRYHAPPQRGLVTGKPKGKPAPLSAQAKQALAAKKANPHYYIPQPVFAELLKLFKLDNGGIPNFQQWLARLVQQGGV